MSEPRFKNTPWRNTYTFAPDWKKLHIKDADNRRIAQVHLDRPQGEAEATGELFAFSPELYEEAKALAQVVKLALEELNEHDTGWYFQMMSRMQKVNIIIRKIEGDL